MELIHTAEDLISIHHIKNLLETAGLESIIKNDRLTSVAGEIPMQNCWPELWLVDESKLELAQKIIAEVKAPESKGETWVCENCGEKHSAQFSDCWNCNGESSKAF